MKTLNSSQQKLLKSVHLIAASVWLTCIIILAVLPLLSNEITDGSELYMYNRIYHFIDILLVTPAALLTFLTGLIYSIFTKWGFFKHGWIVYKWILTLTLILSGTFYLEPMVSKMLDIVELQKMAALSDPYYQQGEVIGIWVAIINSTLLAFAFIVSVYKPWMNKSFFSK